MQDLSLYRQLWVDEFANGTRYRPLPAGALPNTESVLARTLTIPAWGAPAPELVGQYAAAFQKVAGQMAELERYQRERSAG
jgi:dTDP-4-amino-4,6-dideoxygalactose transaminase